MVSLLAIEPLDHLGRVAKKHRVAFRALGGTVTRAGIRVQQNSAISDLFALAPFTADIDLVHDGRASETTTIFNSILETVPAAEAFRWQLASEEERAEENAARKCSNIIPARLMSLSTEPGSGFIDPWNGMDDIAKQNFRYIRNGFYRDSPLYRKGRDLEVFSALLYIQTLFEANVDVAAFAQQAGYHEATAVFAEAATSQEVADSLRGSSYLRARLRYLVKNLTASSPGGPQGEAGFYMTGIDGMLRDLGYESLAESFTAPVSGCFISGASVGVDSERTDDTTEPWLVGEPANLQVQKLFEAAVPLPQNAALPGAGMPLKVAPEQYVVMVSPLIRLKPGHSPSSQFGPGFSHEFLHFDMRLSPETPLCEGDTTSLTADDAASISAVIAVSVTPSDDGSFKHWHFFSVPTAVNISTYKYGDNALNKLQMRINCLSILEEAAPLPYRKPAANSSAYASIPAELRNRKAGVHIILLRLR